VTFIPVMAGHQAALGALSTWSPLSLPSLLGWYDASNAASITSSSGAVSQWSDLSGNNNHLVQAIGGNKPTTGTRTQNGLNAIDFDGTNDFLAKSSLTPSQPVTAMFVCKFDTNAVRMAVVGGGFNVRAGIDDFWHGPEMAATSALVSHTAISTSVASLYTAVFNTGSSALYLNGTSVVSGGDGSQSFFAGINIGATDGTGGQAFDGYVCEVILQSTAIGSTDQTAAEAYLKAKWGTP